MLLCCHITEYIRIIIFTSWNLPSAIVRVKLDTIKCIVWSGIKSFSITLKISKKAIAMENMLAPKNNVNFADQFVKSSSSKYVLGYR